MAPDVTGAGQRPVDQWDQERKQRERPQQTVRPEQLELHDPGACRHQQCEQDAPTPRVGRRLRIRDHEEGEQHEGAALEPMKRNAEGLSETERSASEERDVGDEEREGHVTARCAIHHEPASRRHQEAKDGRAAPLARRDPDAAGEEDHRHQREVRGIENVLATHPQGELARDGDGGCHDRQLEGIGAEQEAQRQSRDEGALRIEDRAPGDSRRCELRQQNRDEDGHGMSDG